MIEKSKTTRDEKETFVVIPTSLTKTFLFNTYSYQNLTLKSDFHLPKTILFICFNESPLKG